MIKYNFHYYSWWKSLIKKRYFKKFYKKKKHKIAVKPPSITNVLPLIYVAFDDDKKYIASAISSALPNLFKGTFLI